jgi:hypothetical protein
MELNLHANATTTPDLSVHSQKPSNRWRVIPDFAVAAGNPTKIIDCVANPD